MRDHHIAPFAQLEPRNGVLVADGWGIRINIHQGHLIVEDGRGATRGTRRLNRATHNLRRLLVLGQGYVTFEALKWCVDADIALVHLGRDGRVLATTTNLGLDHPGLRRAQALAALRPEGVAITRGLLRRKLEGQAQVAASIAGQQAAEQVTALLPDLEAARTGQQLRIVEAAAAAAYFNTWAQVPVRFATADRRRIPDHWLRVGPRSSPISGRSRLAANPANAILNYLYALLEAEARIACLTVGLDPGLGLHHVDERSRDSLALDLMEATRPDVDAYLLDLLRTHVFRASDFHENPRGICRILRPLSHELAATCPTWAERVTPVAEDVARQLGRTVQRLGPALSPQAMSRRSRNSPRRQPSASPSALTIHCTDCGTEIDRPGKRCADCDRQYRTAPDHPRLTRLATLRAQGQDPAHGGTAADSRGRTNAAHAAENIAWEQANPRPDPDVFQRDILPLLQACSPQQLAEATGLSRPYCSLVRAGQRVPHPRHWEALRGSSRACARGEGSAAGS